MAANKFKRPLTKSRMKSRVVPDFGEGIGKPKNIAKSQDNVASFFKRLLVCNVLAVHPFSYRQVSLPSDHCLVDHRSRYEDIENITAK